MEIASALLAMRRPLAPRHATYTTTKAARALAARDVVADEVVVTWFAEPHSYTGEHVVEISAHGSPVVLRAIVDGAIAAGARLAQPGEFTLRAFLNGKRDLVQAEAVGDLIAASTPLQARVAFDQLDGTLTRRIREIDADLFELIARLEASLDFPDEGYHFIQPGDTAAGIAGVIERVDDLLRDARRGRMIREGATVVIAGRPNVGKSSIFNALAGSERAIVTDVPGTTRDLVTEKVDVEGLAVTVVDTAGWRDTVDLVEREGVSRAARARDVADLILLVVDQSEPLTADDERLIADTATFRRIVVANKSDLTTSRAKAAPTEESIIAPTAEEPIVGAGFSRLVSVSARTGAGFADLRRAIATALTGGEALRDAAAVSNQRHIALLEDARSDLFAAQQAAASGATPEEFVLTDLQAARTRFDDIVGARTSEDVLRHIFERFCIGK